MTARQTSCRTARYKPQGADNSSDPTVIPFSHSGSLAQRLEWQNAKIELLSTKACLLLTVSSSGSCEKSGVKRPSPAVKCLMKKKEEGRTHQLRSSPNINKNRSTSLSCAAAPSQPSSAGFSPTWLLSWSQQSDWKTCLDAIMFLKAVNHCNVC